MAEKIQLKSITSEFAANEISKLADRPNQSSTYGEGGLSAAALKSRFDALSKILRDDVKAIADTISSSQAANYIGLDGSVNGKTSLAELLQGINTGDFSEDLQVEYLSEEGETKIPLNTAIALLQLANSQLNEKVDLLPNTVGKNYVDIAEYVEEGVVNSTAFNAKLSELAAQSRGGNDRVDIYFYMSRNIVFDFDTRIVWQSNCNYHYISYERSQPIQSSIISLNNISNCQFKGFSIRGMPELDNYALSLNGCTNIEFYDCTFYNYYETAVCISNCKSIYFNDCHIRGGNFPPPGSFDNQYQHECVVINDTESIRSWIIFENCFIEQAMPLASTPLFDCSGVTNTKSALFVLHCITNDNEDVSAINFSKGSGKIRISALTSV